MKTCIYCSKEVEDNAVKCKHCGGWFTNNAEEIQKQRNANQQLEKLVENKDKKISEEISENTQYFYVPQSQMIVLSLLTMGFFELFWFYKNWQAIKVQEGKKISPFWRAFFTFLFCFSLFKRVLSTAAYKGYATKYTPVVLTLLYIGFALLYKLPAPFDLLDIFSFIPLLPVNAAIRHINLQVNPLFEQKHKLSKFEIGLVVIGIIFWILTILGFLMPEEPVVVEGIGP